jgi:hypothetical protein
MVMVREYPSDVVFTPSVKAAQQRKESRRGYDRIEENGSWQHVLPFGHQVAVSNRRGSLILLKLAEIEAAGGVPE